MAKVTAAIAAILVMGLAAGCATPAAPVMTVRPAAKATAAATLALQVALPAAGRGAYALQAVAADVATLTVTVAAGGKPVATARVARAQMAGGQADVRFANLAAGTHVVTIVAADAAGKAIGETREQVTLTAGKTATWRARLALAAAAAKPTAGLALAIEIVEAAPVDAPVEVAVGTPTPRPSASASPAGPAAPGADLSGPGRGFPEAGRWLSYYGTPETMGDLAAVAATHRVINLDADPDVTGFTPAQIATLKAGGRNRVLSYFNIGSVETWRSYWAAVPAGYQAPATNLAAQIGAYSGYADEIWMNPADPAWQAVLLDVIAPRLVAQGVDGFYFDNLELLEHGTDTANGACDAGCNQAGLDFMRKLRAKYPNLLFVMQNGTSDATRLGRTGGMAYAELLDGVAHESVFTQPSEAEDAKDAVYEERTDEWVLAELRAWRDMRLTPGGRPFWIGAMEYVNTCDNVAGAQRVTAKADAEGFSLAIADKSALLQDVCGF